MLRFLLASSLLVLVSLVTFQRSSLTVLAVGSFSLPYNGSPSAVTQLYSTGHPAIDFGINHVPVYAVADGTVVQAVGSYPDQRNDSRGWANYVRISHPSLGLVTAYAHLAPFDAAALRGRTVRRGEQIAVSGHSGYATGHHLHFEVRNNSGAAVNPGDPSFSGNCGLWATCPATYIPPPPLDTDGDGIPNSTDACDTVPEDDDNYLDSDGCPDPMQHVASSYLNNGRYSDLALFYRYGQSATTIHMFPSSGTDFGYVGDAGCWGVPSGYTLARTIQSIPGDFDGNSLTDMAVVYDYGNSETRVHVWLSTGSSCEYQGSSGWWSAGPPPDGSYTATNVKLAVPGDFDRDGLSDIALFYQYGQSATTIHVLRSTGTRFEYEGNDGWWEVPSGYSLDQVVQAIPGDFNADGRGDIATIYDYGDSQTRAHVWLSTGSSFDYQGSSGWWVAPSGSYTAGNVRHAVPGDFNRDGRSDVALFYRYGQSATRIHVLLSNGSRFNYQGDNGWWRVDSGYTLDRVVHAIPGDFNGDGASDIAAVYDYGNSETRIHVWLSTTSALNYRGSSGWWRSGPPPNGSYRAHAAIHGVPGDGRRRDNDREGCLNVVELGLDAATGGQRDAMLYWDFFDTPDGANTRDKIVAIADITRVVERFGSVGDPAVGPQSLPPAASSYHPAFDRTRAGPNDWNSGAPDGRVTIADIGNIAAQFGHTCAGGP